MGKYFEKNAGVDAIHAIQWDGKKHPDVLLNEGKTSKPHEFAPGESTLVPPGYALIAGTTSVLEPGDYIVTAEDGSKVAMNPGVFSAKYGAAPALKETTEPYGICDKCAIRPDCFLQNFDGVTGVAVLTCTSHEAGE